eukprot:gene31790-50673_t
MWSPTMVVWRVSDVGDPALAEETPVADDVEPASVDPR